MSVFKTRYCYVTVSVAEDEVVIYMSKKNVLKPNESVVSALMLLPSVTVIYN